MERRSMKVLRLELCNCTLLKEVLTSMSTEAVCPICRLHHLPGSTLSHWLRGGKCTQASDA